MLRAFFMIMIIAGMLGLVAYTASPAYGFSGKVERVSLKENTQFTLKVVPKLGSRLIFPFILDDSELKPPLNYKLTNTDDFLVTRNLNALAGQNVFLITSTGNNGAIGKLYMSIAGYNIAINLVVSNLVKDHVSDIYLELNEDDRSFLITKEVERIKDNLNQNYANRIKQTKAIIADKTIAEIMRKGTRKKNIKELFRGGLSGADGGKSKFKSADIYMDKFIYRKPDAYGLHFWVEHYGKKFAITSMLIQLEGPQGNRELADGELFCHEYSERLEECLYITNSPGIIGNELKMIVTLTNDKDEVFIINY